ncbi:MAG: tripartite tricarboxylate transporter substrate binding protein [Burkholderiales bacterium]
MLRHTYYVVRGCGLAWCLTATFALGAQPASTGSAQLYPAKPVRMIVAGPAGSGPEVVARQLAAKLTEAWGQQVVVDPRPGATGLIGADIVAKSAPDGYTLWFATSTQLLGTTLYQRNWMAKEYAPIGMFSSTAFAIAVSSSLPANTIAEFIAYAKARPGKLLYGSNGQGSTSHLCTELFRALAGIDLVHVPYKGGVPALVDLAGGQIQLSCQPLPSLPLVVKTGRVRTLAVTTARRTRIAPDVPPVAETIPGFEILGWHGLLAPLHTPRGIIDKVNAAATRVALSADMQERMLSLGVEAAPSTPAEFGARLHAETTKWAKVLKDANIRPNE